ncbi:transposase [bacterium]|nr:transposase [bacterium]
MWVNVEQAAELMSVSYNTVIYRIKAGILTHKQVASSGRKGFKYEISLDSLPQDAQDRYWEQQRIADQVARAKRGGRPSKAALEARAKAAEEIQANEIYQKAPDWQKSVVDTRVYIVESTKGMSQKETMAWIDQYNMARCEEDRIKCSLGTLYRWRKAYTVGGKNALMTEYGNRKGSSIIPDDVWDVWYGVYATESKVSAQAAWLVARGYYTEHYEGQMPSLSAFEYRLQRDIKEQDLYYARNGASAYNRKFGYYIKRDLSKLTAGECAVGDHMQFDLMVEMPDGKVVRPWLTAWVDMKSRKFLGWYAHPEAPNSDHIFQSFYHMASKFGLPKELYLDNGKDYRCKDFAGGRRTVKVEYDRERIVSSLTADLGIEVNFALPYNAQAKVIERRFKDHHNYFERLLVGYTGTNTAKRPEALKKQLKKKQILKWAQFVELLEQFISVLDSMPFGARAHFAKLSPNEIWKADNPALRRANPESLALFCMRSSRLIKVGRNGVKDPDLKVTYWAPELDAIKGQPVYMRRDLNNYSQAWIFSAKDELICLATIDDGVHPLAKTPESKAELAERMARKRRELKALKAAQAEQTALAADELMRLEQAGVASLNEERGADDAEPDSKVIQLQNTPLDKRSKEIKRYLKEATTDSPVIPVPSVERKPRRILAVWDADEI